MENHEKGCCKDGTTSLQHLGFVNSVRVCSEKVRWCEPMNINFLIMLKSVEVKKNTLTVGTVGIFSFIGTGTRSLGGSTLFSPPGRERTSDSITTSKLLHIRS